MWRSFPLLIVLWTLHTTAAWAEGWTEPHQVLGLPWGTPLEVARQQVPGGRWRQETSLTMTYSTGTRFDGIPLGATFQFVAGQGLQGVILRFPVRRLPEMVGVFEREYGRAPIRGNREWRWQGPGVRISLGEYPSLATRGRVAVAWIRTGALEAAVARGRELSPLSRGDAAASGGAHRAGEQKSQGTYEERLLRKIYWQLRYPQTSHGVYLVSVSFRLTPTGRPADLEVAVDPPNPDVAESVRAAVSRAQPFPPPPVVQGDHAGCITLALTVTIMP